MDIQQAKQQIKDTVEAYLAKDKLGLPLIDISEQRPLFLLGAPGIGKTAIVGQVAHDLDIGIVSYSMTHHTRQSALGLPFIVHREFEGLSYDASEYTMSEIVASLYDYMEKTGKRRGILFLDEINCVSETLYPSMLQFLQFKTFGRHRIPADWVVVCAGNPPEYNKSVHEFDIVTLDRLRKITLSPDYNAWKEYAASEGVHPAILSFLELKKDCFYAVESTPEGKSFVTARGWVDLSKTISLFERMEKTVDLNVIQQFLQMPEIAEQFDSYYKLFRKYCADYQVSEILSGSATPEIYERASAAEFDERLAVLSLMLDELASTQLDLLETQKAIERVRDILRALKEQLEGGATIEETLGERIHELARLAARDADESLRSLEEVRISGRVHNMLSELYHECEVTGKRQGSEAFDAMHFAYRGFVSDLEKRIAEEAARLDNAFDFISTAFEDDREMLVFVTELTARRATSQFINQFGSEKYYANNNRLMYAENSEDLKARISAKLESLDASGTAGSEGEAGVGTGAAAGAGAPIASAAASGMGSSTTGDAIADYYKNAQFEYGFASLCNMTIPVDLKNKMVLNMGCRRGKGVFKMSDMVGNNGRVVGIDWSPDYIEEASSRMDRAWKKSGLERNNMEFHVAYPEDLMAAGLADESFDVVFMNSVINLAYSPEEVYKEVFRVLKPGGIFVCETVLADSPRDSQVVEGARKLGNSIQAAPFIDDFEKMIGTAGFKLSQYIAPYEIAPDTGFKLSHKAEMAPSSEDVIFTAQVAELIKPK